MSEIEKYQAPRGLGDVMQLGRVFAQSGMFTDAPNNDVGQAKAIVKILAGQENGVAPFAAMTGIHIIQGKPEIGSGLLARMVKQSGRYDYRVQELSDEKCRIAFFEHGDHVGDSEFTAADARRAGTQNLQKFPRNMLFARAMSNGVKWFCPDAASGPVYAEGELSDAPPRALPSGVVEGEIVEDDEPAAPTPAAPAPDEALVRSVGAQLAAWDDAAKMELQVVTGCKGVKALVAKYGAGCRDMEALLAKLRDSDEQVADFAAFIEDQEREHAAEIAAESDRKRLQGERQPSVMGELVMDANGLGDTLASVPAYGDPEPKPRRSRARSAS